MYRHSAHQKEESPIAEALVRKDCSAGDREELVARRVGALEPLLCCDVIDPLASARWTDWLTLGPAGLEKYLSATVFAHRVDIVDCQRAALWPLEPVRALLLSFEGRGCAGGHIGVVYDTLTATAQPFGLVFDTSPGIFASWRLKSRHERKA